MSGQRVERRHRLVQDEEPWPPGQSEGERELRLLTARQLASLPVQRDAQVGQAGFGIALIEVPIQVAGQVQHVGDREVVVQRGVLGYEGDAVERGP